MSSAKVGVSGTIWSLYAHNEAIDEEHDVVLTAIFRVYQVLLKLRQVLNRWQLDKPVQVDIPYCYVPWKF